MDRSFLSQPEVITASRNFVCLRLLTYENQKESDFLKSLLRTRSGELENTVFCILSPDGQRMLTPAARTTQQLFPTPAVMSRVMNRIAGSYPVESATTRDSGDLPKIDGVRLAINVASSDNQPLIVLYSSEPSKLRMLEEKMRGLAWSDPYLGRFTFAVATEAGQLAAIEGADKEEGLIVIQPDQFGLRGTVLARAKPDASPPEWEQTLKSGLAKFRPMDKTFQNHVWEGQRKGVFWESLLPVTDPMEQAARERGRRR